jgi:hypothetical protein
MTILDCNSLRLGLKERLERMKTYFSHGLNETNDEGVDMVHYQPYSTIFGWYEAR